MCVSGCLLVVRARVYESFDESRFLLPISSRQIDESISIAKLPIKSTIVHYFYAIAK